MFSETQRLAVPGASLAYHHSEAITPPRVILLISHGLAEHSKRYRSFAETKTALAKAMPGTQSGLERHEWVKHGTCTKMS
ncbi:hypothetical protein ACC754_41935, partial [Rhizobium johnstonii]